MIRQYRQYREGNGFGDSAAADSNTTLGGSSASPLGSTQQGSGETGRLRQQIHDLMQLNERLRRQVARLQDRVTQLENHLRNKG